MVSVTKSDDTRIPKLWVYGDCNLSIVFPHLVQSVFHFPYYLERPFIFLVYKFKFKNLIGFFCVDTCHELVDSMDDSSNVEN